VRIVAPNAELVAAAEKVPDAHGVQVLSAVAVAAAE
jgi:hypothetical protein